MDSKWDHRFLRLAREVSTWSKDPSTKVGAVLVKDGKVQGLGYNGFPRGVEDHADRYEDRDLKYPMTVHAEVNAILQAGHASKGATLYVYPPFGVPNICADCAGAAIQAGVLCVVQYLPDPERLARWNDSLSIAHTMWQEAGLATRTYQEEI